MAYFLLTAIALVLMVTGFNRAYCIHGINQVYLGLYKGIFDASVAVATSTGDYRPIPRFYFAKAKALLSAYYEEHLPPYCRRYTFTIEGRSANSSSYSAFLSYADTIRTTFTVWINDVEARSKEAVFSIERSPFYD